MESLSFSPRHPEGKKSPPFQSFPSPCFIHIVLPPLTFLDPATAPQNRDTTWKVMQKVRGTEVKMRGSGARKRRERKKHHEQITVSFFFFLFCIARRYQAAGASSASMEGYLCDLGRCILRAQTSFSSQFFIITLSTPAMNAIVIRVILFNIITTLHTPFQ